MANIKYRLRRRQNGLVRIVDLIDITDDTKPVEQKFIEVIDLTGNDETPQTILNPERLDDFRQRIFSSFHRFKKETMSLLRLARHVNMENKDKFSKMEIHSALRQMADANEIFISRDELVNLI